MTLEMILAAALGVAPILPQEPVPQRVLIPQGTTFECTAPGGCYLANEQGLGEMVREIADRVRQQCRREPGI